MPFQLRPEEDFTLLTDPVEIAHVAENVGLKLMPDHQEVTAAAVRAADGDYADLLITHSSRPFDRAASFEWVIRDRQEILPDDRTVCDLDQAGREVIRRHLPHVALQMPAARDQDLIGLVDQIVAGIRSRLAELPGGMTEAQLVRRPGETLLFDQLGRRIDVPDGMSDLLLNVAGQIRTAVLVKDGTPFGPLSIDTGRRLVCSCGGRETVLFIPTAEDYADLMEPEAMAAAPAP